MSDTDRGQLIASAAEIYDAFFVPALFSQWTDIVLAAADAQEGHRILDVGCGTGVLARAARRVVGDLGAVIGIDPNEGMLSVARGLDPSSDWRTGVAERLPFPDSSFDRTISQFAFMFFTDAQAALSEMCRVTAPGGRVTFAVWDRLENNCGYLRLAALLETLFGAAAGDAVRTPFSLGDDEALAQLAAQHLDGVSVTTHSGVARFESLEAWLHTEIRGWTLADKIDDGGFARLVAEACVELSDLVGSTGVEFEVIALVVSGRPQ